MSVNAQNTMVVIRHGIFSDAKAMSGLRAACIRILPHCHVDNKDYRWQESILHSGVKLARHVGQMIVSQPALKKLILVGHSQGGLVCRIAAAALLAPVEFLAILRTLRANDKNYYDVAIYELESLVQETGACSWRTIVRGVAMLATPNSGALTYGQISLQAQLAVGAAKQLALHSAHRRHDYA